MRVSITELRQMIREVLLTVTGTINMMSEEEIRQMILDFRTEQKSNYSAERETYFRSKFPNPYERVVTQKEAWAEWMFRTGGTSKKNMNDIQAYTSTEDGSRWWYNDSVTPSVTPAYFPADELALEVFQSNEQPLELPDPRLY